MIYEKNGFITETRYNVINYGTLFFKVFECEYKGWFSPHIFYIWIWLNNQRLAFLYCKKVCYRWNQYCICFFILLHSVWERTIKGIWMYDVNPKFKPLNNVNMIFFVWQSHLRTAKLIIYCNLWLTCGLQFI